MALGVRSSTQVALLDQHSLGIELISAVRRSGNELVADGRKTIATVARFKESMEARCRALESTNQTLTKKIVALESEQREKAVLLEKQLAQALQREQAAKQEAEALRQEKIETEKRGAEHMSAALATQARVLQAESQMQASEVRALAAERDAAVSKQETAEVRADAAQKEAVAEAEKKAAVAAATELGQAQIATEKQKTAEALQREAESEKKLKTWELWRKDTETIVVQGVEIVNEYRFRLISAAAGLSFENPWADQFRKFIQKRACESLDLITDAAQQRFDTKELQQFALSTPLPYWVDTHTLMDLKAKLLEFCKARIERGT